MRYCVCDRQGKKLCDNMMPLRVMEPFLRVLLMFEQGEILFDIQNLAAAQGESAKETVKDGVMLKNFIDICGESNIERPIKTIPVAISRCESMLHEWTKHQQLNHFSLDNLPEDKPEFIIEMQVEKHFSNSTAWSLMRNIQEYVEAYVLWDWAGLNYPDGKKHWEDVMLAAEASIAKEMSYMDDDCGARISANW